MQRRTIWLLSVIVLAVVITMAIMRVAVENLTFQADVDPATGLVVLGPVVMHANKDGTYTVNSVRVFNDTINEYPCPDNYTKQPIADPVFYKTEYASKIVLIDNPYNVNWTLKKSSRTFSDVVGYDKTYIILPDSGDGKINAQLDSLVEKVLPDPVHRLYLQGNNMPYDFLYVASEVIGKHLIGRNSVALPTPNNPFLICQLKSGTDGGSSG